MAASSLGDAHSLGGSRCTATSHATAFAGAFAVCAAARASIATEATSIATGTTAWSDSSLGCALAGTRTGIEHVACGHGGYSSNNDREFR